MAFFSRCEIKVWIFKVLNAEFFLKQPRNVHGAALENQAGCVEGTKLWNHKSDGSSIQILAMPEGMLWQTKYIDSNNLTMIAQLTWSPRREGTPKVTKSQQKAPHFSDH